MPRPRPTWIDYMVIAVSPALIIAMLASFAFFLNEVFYGGYFTGRMNFIFFMYVIGATLITRIGVEQGSSQAALYAIPLAFLTWIATLRFVEYSGRLEAVSGPLNIAILAILWWAAHSITWDCTVIDESNEVDENGDRSDDSAGLFDWMGEESEDGPPVPMWKRLLGMADRSRRGRAHGASVVFFSLFALAIFGLGQVIRPTDDLEFRRYLFRLVCQVIAAALALLVTTNLLCIRRYLRQRGVTMPGDMVSVWLISGGGIIAALLLACLILPRPNPEYSLSQVELTSYDNDLKSNPWGMGKGIEDDNASQAKSQQNAKRSGDGSSSKKSDGGRSTDSNNKKSKSGKGESGKGESGKGESGKGESGKGESGKGESGKGESGKGESGKGESGKGESGKGESGKGESGKGESGKGDDSDKGDSGKEKSGEKDGGQNSEKKGSNNSRAMQDRSGERQQDQRQQQRDEREQKSQRKASSSPKSPSRISQLFGKSLSAILKMFVWVYYAIIIAIVVYGCIRYREAILNALRKFWHDLMELINNLFGTKTESGSAAVEVNDAPPQKSFREFSSPFVGGQMRFSLEQAVVYTFEALNAWGRDQGLPRDRDVTPHEFAAKLGSHFPQIGGEAHSLADLYGQLVFAGGKLPRDAANKLQALWQKLQTPIPANNE